MSKVRFTVGGSVIFHAVTWLRLNFTASYSLIVSSFFTVSLFGTPITSEPQKKRGLKIRTLVSSQLTVLVQFLFVKKFSFFLHTFRSLTVSHINGLSFAISKFSHYFVHRLLNCVHPQTQLYASYIDKSRIASIEFDNIHPSLIIH